MKLMLKGKRILVVDDEPDLRDILKDEFEFCGATVAIAENGKEALHLIKETTFDLILSDIRMPGGDGVTLAKEVKAMNHSKPVMMLITGFADITSDRAYDLGIEGFFTKPFNLEVITRSAQSAMLEPNERWSRPYAGTAPVKALPSGGEFEELKRQKSLSLGRGGFFLKGEVPQIRVSDVVKFDFGPQLQGTGQVKWVRSEPDGDLAGLGVEILFLEPGSLSAFLAEMNMVNPEAYIPKS
ncbi:MAG: hypothetical protein BroJett040_02510 [Oligoflexia bacterium]|nr:MAG: hypothetical protein BroJett040_02510 [Oligoflexia bacterium]